MATDDPIGVHRIVTDEGIKPVSDESATRFMRYYTEVQLKPTCSPRVGGGTSESLAKAVEETNLDEMVAEEPPLKAMEGDLLEEVSLLCESLCSSAKDSLKEDSIPSSPPSSAKSPKAKTPFLEYDETDDSQPTFRHDDFGNYFHRAVGEPEDPSTLESSWCSTSERDEESSDGSCPDLEEDSEVWDSLTSISTILNRMQYFLVNNEQATAPSS